MTTIGSRNYADTDVFQLKTRNEQLKLHKLNIKKIKKTIDNSPPVSLSRYPRSKSQLRALYSQTPQQSKLKDKLCEISKRKNIDEDLTPHRSLNVDLRKKEAKRIDEENHSLAYRLISQESKLSFKKLKKEYLNSISHKNRISRANQINLANKLVKKEWYISTERSRSVSYM